MVNHNAEFMSQNELEALGFAALGQSVLMHRSVVLVGCEKISLGDHVRVDPFTILSAGAEIAIGTNVHIASHCSFTGSAPIWLGDFCGISHGTRVFSANDDYSGAAMTGPTVPERFRNIDSAPVRIGRHAVIGSGGVILPGSVIGEGVAVGALSLIKGVLDDWSIYSGVPAKRRRARSKDLLMLEAEYRRS